MCYTPPPRQHRTLDFLPSENSKSYINSSKPQPPRWHLWNFVTSLTFMSPHLIPPVAPPPPPPPPPLDNFLNETLTSISVGTANYHTSPAWHDLQSSLFLVRCWRSTMRKLRVSTSDMLWRFNWPHPKGQKHFLQENCQKMLKNNNKQIVSV